MKSTEDVKIYFVRLYREKKAFESYLPGKEMVHSFNRKGNPYNNACIEFFHSVLKKEEIYLHTYQDSKEGGV